MDTWDAKNGNYSNISEYDSKLCEKFVISGYNISGIMAIKTMNPINCVPRIGIASILHTGQTLLHIMAPPIKVAIVAVGITYGLYSSHFSDRTFFIHESHTMQ